MFEKQNKGEHGIWKSKIKILKTKKNTILLSTANMYLKLTKVFGEFTLNSIKSIFDEECISSKPIYSLSFHQLISSVQTTILYLF